MSSPLAEGLAESPEWFWEVSNALRDPNADLVFHRLTTSGRPAPGRCLVPFPAQAGYVAINLTRSRPTLTFSRHWYMAPEPVPDDYGAGRYVLSLAGEDLRGFEAATLFLARTGFDVTEARALEATAWWARVRPAHTAPAEAAALNAQAAAR